MDNESGIKNRLGLSYGVPESRPTRRPGETTPPGSWTDELEINLRQLRFVGKGTRGVWAATVAAIVVGGLMAALVGAL